MPEVLIWARSAIGMDEETAARTLVISESTLSKWESGGLGPTIKQLRKAAAVYRVPLAVLLLPEPPTTYQPIRDYRRIVDGDTTSVSPALHTEIRRAEMQREVFLELLELAPDSISDTVELSLLAMTQSPEEAGKRLREYVGVSLKRQHGWRSPNEAINGWVDAIESKGILVIHTSRVGIDEVRGFSLSEIPFPVIGLNGADWPRPRVFTLFHELAHIALNLGGLCDLHEQDREPTQEADKLERFCNAAAAAAIVPLDDLLSSALVARSSEAYEWSLDELRSLANRYMISAEAVLLRLITIGKVSWDLYWARKRELEALYDEDYTKEKQRQKEADGGPSYYTVKARNIGHGYAHSVLDAYRARAISALDVSDYLQVKYNQIPRLQKVLR